MAVTVDTGIRLSYSVFTLGDLAAAFVFFPALEAVAFFFVVEAAGFFPAVWVFFFAMDRLLLMPSGSG